jgi:hypothetical protein
MYTVLSGSLLSFQTQFSIEQTNQEKMGQQPLEQYQGFKNSFLKNLARNQVENTFLQDIIDRIFLQDSSVKQEINSNK